MLNSRQASRDTNCMHIYDYYTVICRQLKKTEFEVFSLSLQARAATQLDNNKACIFLLMKTFFYIYIFDNYLRLFQELHLGTVLQI